jgi:hypothetical protein
MSNESDIRRGRHCVFKLCAQLVFVAKYRRRVFDALAIDVLRAIFADVGSDARYTDIHDSFAAGAILPRPEGRGLPRVLVSSRDDARPGEVVELLDGYADLAENHARIGSGLLEIAPHAVALAVYFERQGGQPRGPAVR